VLRKNLTISNRLGLHARSAAKFVEIAKQFNSNVTLSRNQQSANGKEIMSVLLLAAPKGTAIELVVSGRDEDMAFKSLSELILNGFNENDSDP
tara:strand:- start:588 stop:866 length:279 start_codon:yes stop_codon:yes gene_type:complete